MEHFYIAFWLMEIFHKLCIIFSPFKEIVMFGYNVETLFFLLTFIFSLGSAYTLFEQSQIILKKKSGQSISFLFYGFIILPASAVAFYGHYTLSLALVFNGICISLTGILVIVNLLRYHRYPKWEIVLGFSALISLPLVIVLPAYERDIAFFLFGLTVLIMLQKQNYTLWKRKDVGSLHFGPALNGIFSSTSWMIYGFLMNVWPVKVFNVLVTISWATFLILYFVYNKKRVATYNKSIQ